MNGGPGAVIRTALQRRRYRPVKEGIHPQYQELEVVCACGAKFTTRSTAKKIHVEICADCHPFYTGQQKMVDTAGRIERFNKKYEKFNARS